MLVARTELCSLLLSMVVLSTAQIATDPVKNMCSRWYHQCMAISMIWALYTHTHCPLATVRNGTLYIIGGMESFQNVTDGSLGFVDVEVGYSMGGPTCHN